MGEFRQLAAQFDPANKKRKGDQFEAVCKWFLENDPSQYKPLLRKVWLWDDWTGNWGIDAGIDLVAEDIEGRFWAIQAKAYEGTVTRSEVNKFLAEAARFDFAHRILMATTDKLSLTAQRTMEDLGVTFIGLTELEEFEDWPAKLSDLRAAKPPKPKKPWDYQRPAIKAVVKGFKTADRGQLIMACGTGKTLTAWFIKEKLAAERTLVLVPSLSLLKQTMKEWRTADVNHPFEALPVCSDETAGKDDDLDAAISHTSYLGEPANTSPEVIAAFLRKRSGPRVVFSTYQSSPQIEAAFKLGRVPAFDLVIADEAHRVAGPVKRDFATVLDGKKIKGKRRLYMTATPRIYSSRGRRAGMDVDYEYASMDDPVKFGREFYRLSFSEAIERELLSDYQVVIVGVDEATYLEWADRGELVTLEGTKIDTDARSLAGQIGLAKTMRKYDLRRIITFHGRVSRAREFAQSMPQVLEWMPTRQRPKGKLWSQYASGEMTAGERHRLLQHLKRLDDADRGLLANARCLAEGVDVPALDGVAFIDPRRSEVDIIQAVGRAIRKSDTKKVGTIVIPVFIDTTEDPETALDNDKYFKPVWDVVRALRSHDDELGRQLDDLRRQLGRRRAGRPHIPEKIHDDDLRVTVGDAFIRAFEARLVEQTTASWEFWFGLLERFISLNGHVRVPRGEAFEGFQLGQWVQNQRARRERLSGDQRQRLAELPGWSWDPRDDLWEEGFNRLVAYVDEHGDARVPRDCTVDGYKLGQWVVVQRVRYAGDGLDLDRKRRLEELNGWVWDARADNWEEGFTRLEEFVREKGHARVPQPYKIDGYPLGHWVSAQRAFYRREALAPQRIQRLEGVAGWVWNARVEKWEEGFAALQQFADENGHAVMPALYKTADGYPLGQWVASQRYFYGKGELDPTREQRLESVPGWSWDPDADFWEEGFRHLEEYVQQYGDARPPHKYQSSGDNFKLGYWVLGQRQKQAKGKLEADRARRLADLPGWTWRAR